MPLMLMRRNAKATIASDFDALLLSRSQIPARLDVRNERYPISLSVGSFVAMRYAPSRDDVV